MIARVVRHSIVAGGLAVVFPADNSICQFDNICVMSSCRTPSTSLSDQNSPAASATSGPTVGPLVFSSILGGARLLGRYVGQCNVQTDIKEAQWLGADDDFVACGSDCGRVFIYRTVSWVSYQIKPKTLPGRHIDSNFSEQ